MNQEVGTQVAPVNLGYEVMEDPHMRAREAVVRVEIPGGSTMWQVGPPYKLSVTRGAIWRPATLAGQDTTAILAELGYSPQDVRTLTKDKVVDVAPDR